MREFRLLNFFLEQEQEPWQKFKNLLRLLLPHPKEYKKVSVSENFFLNSISIAITLEFMIRNRMRKSLRRIFIKGNLIEHKSEWKTGSGEENKGEISSEIMCRNWAWINICAFYRFRLVHSCHVFVVKLHSHTRRHIYAFLWKKEFHVGDNLIHHI